MPSPCEAHGCALCCYDTEMPLTEADLARLAALGHAPEAFSRPGRDGFVLLRTREPEAGATARPCFFLRDGRCSVYEARPEGCRIYPFVWSPSDAVVRDEDCPYREEFPRPPGVRRLLVRVVGRVEREARARERTRPEG